MGKGHVATSRGVSSTKSSFFSISERLFRSSLVLARWRLDPRQSATHSAASWRHGDGFHAADQKQPRGVGAGASHERARAREQTGFGRYVEHERGFAFRGASGARERRARAVPRVPANRGARGRPRASGRGQGRKESPGVLEEHQWRVLHELAGG